MVTIEDFKNLELKVAKILEAKAHPNADKLLLLSIEVGEEKKQIVAGIARHYQPEALVGKLIVVVNNLEPALLRGEESQGMLLAAQDGETLTLIGPEKAVATGAQVR
jgi:methionine--tRNA ligase beta chain